MDTNASPAPVLSHPRVGLLMVLCGIVGAAPFAAVNAADAAADVPAITVKYDPQSLATDSGARAVYRRLVRAAAEVCPDMNVGTRIVSSDVQQCRKQAVERAVHSINHPRLAAIDAASATRG